MNINSILNKSFHELTPDDCVAINNYLLDRMLIELQKKDRSGIYGITQREFAYNSNRIEGSRLSREQTASLFNTGTIMSDGEIYRAKDIEETNGHFLMFNLALKTINEVLSEPLIKQFHAALKQGVFEDRANGYPIGEYKNRQNVVWDIETVKPNQIHEKMCELLGIYLNSEKSLIDITKLHAEYEKIHPFQDGNGRTGRMILFRECLKNGIIPFVICDENKNQYTHLLNAAQKTEDFAALAGYFEEEACKYYEILQEFLRVYENKD